MTRSGIPPTADISRQFGSEGDEVYDAFLCYSRDQDTELAIALRKGLLHLGRRWYRRRALKDVFRDDSSLSAGPLWPPIQDALDTSRYLVLLASKEAAGSEYVKRELSYWCEHREAENLLIVVTEPRPEGGDSPPAIAWDVERNDFDWSATSVLPSCLSGAYPTEPRWIRLPRTTPRLSLRDPAFKLSVANVAAPLHGRGVDDLIAEDIRQQWRRVIFIMIAAAAIFITSVVAVIFGISATNAKNELQQQLRTAVAGRLLAQADALRDTDPGAALRLGLAADVVAEGSSDNGAISQETAAGLMRTLGTTPGLLIGQPISRSGAAYSVTYGRNGLLAIGGSHGVVSLWDTADRAHPRELGHLVIGNGNDDVNSLAFQPGGRTLAAAAGATVEMVDVHDPANPRPRSQPLSTGARFVRSLAVSTDGRILAAGETGGTTTLWDVTDPGHPRPFGTLTGHTADVNSVAFTPAGRILATGSTDHTVRLWDLAAARPVQLGQPLDSRIGPIWSITFSPDGRTLAVGAESPYGSVVLWDVTNPGHPRVRGKALFGQEESVRALAFSPDGQRLAIGGTDNTITQYDVTSPDQPRWLGAPLTGHTNAVVALAFAPDSHTLASGSYDGTVLLFDTSRDSYRPRLLGTRLAGQTTPVWNVAYSPNGHMLATGSIQPEPSVWLWDVRDRDHPRRLHKLVTNGAFQVSALAFSPDSRTLAVADGVNTISLWDIATPTAPERIGQISLANANILSVAFSPDGRHLAASVFGQGFIGVTFWDIHDRSSPRQEGQFKPPGQYGPISSVTYNPDGSTVAVGTYNGTVDIVDPAGGYNPPYREYTGHSGPVFAVTYNPAGTLLASASADGTLRLWKSYDHSTRLQRIGQPLTGHANKVDAVAFSPDGKLLASGSYDNSIILWLVADPTHPAQLTPPLIGRVSPVRSVAFSPDGQTLAAGTSLPGVLLWDIDPLRQALANPRQTACSLTGGLDQATWNSYAPEIPYRPIC